MTPFWQTVLTLTMMVFAYGWGYMVAYKSGWLRGRLLAMQIFVSCFEAKQAVIDYDNLEITFEYGEGKLVTSQEFIEAYQNGDAQGDI